VTAAATRRGDFFREAEAPSPAIVFRHSTAAGRNGDLSGQEIIGGEPMKLATNMFAGRS